MSLDSALAPISAIVTLAAVGASGAAFVRFLESLHVRRRQLELLEIAVGAASRVGPGAVQEGWRAISAALVKSRTRDAPRPRVDLALFLGSVMLSAVTVVSTWRAVLNPITAPSEPEVSSQITVTSVLLVNGVAYFSLVLLVSYLMIRALRTAPTSGVGNA